MTISNAIRARRTRLDGLLLSLACLVAAGGFLARPISWLLASQGA